MTPHPERHHNLRPGAAIGHHSHNCVESAAVIEGTAYADIDGTEHYLNTYDTTFVPANIVHRFRNASNTKEMKILDVRLHRRDPNHGRPH